MVEVGDNLPTEGAINYRQIHHLNLMRIKLITILFLNDFRRFFMIPIFIILIIMAVSSRKKNKIVLPN